MGIPVLPMTKKGVYRLFISTFVHIDSICPQCSAKTAAEVLLGERKPRQTLPNSSPKYCEIIRKALRLRFIPR